MVLIGDPKQIQLSFLRPIIPFQAYPLRQPPFFWPARTSLQPLTSPLYELTENDRVTSYGFFLYNPSLLTPLIEQGNCGSCWAICVCYMLADRLAIHSEGRFRFALSPQNLIDCFSESCERGGSPEKACLWLQNSRHSVHLLTDQAYVSSRGVQFKCKDIRYRFQCHTKPQSLIRLTEFITDTMENATRQTTIARNIQRMKHALEHYGPIVASIAVYENLYNHDGQTIYRHSSGQLIGGHAIEIIGYNDKDSSGHDTRTPFQDNYWICRSSWTKDWPRNTSTPGYFMILMGENVCGVESRCCLAAPEGRGEIPFRYSKLKPIRFTSFDTYYDANDG